MSPEKETLCPEMQTDIDKPHWNRRLPTHSQTYTHPPQPKSQCHCFEHSWPLCFTYLSHSATVELCSFIQRGCATHRAVYRLRQSACVLSFWVPFKSYTTFLKSTKQHFDASYKVREHLLGSDSLHDQNTTVNAPESDAHVLSIFHNFVNDLFLLCFLMIFDCMIHLQRASQHVCAIKKIPE